MKSNSTLTKKVAFGIFLLIVAGLVSLAAAPADAPLSKDDVTLLLLGGSSSGKVIQIVDQRGVDVQMNPDLAKKFHDQGASDDLIEALRKAGEKAAAAKASAPPAPAPATTSAIVPAPNPSAAPSAPDASPEAKPNSPDAPQPRAEEPPPPAPAAAAPSREQSSSSDEPVLHTRQTAHEDSSSAPSPHPAAAVTSDQGNATADTKIQEILDGLAGHPEASGGQAPLLRIKDINGRKLTPDDFKGKVVLVNFWATWCPYCKTEIPELVQLQQKYGWAGFQVVGIAVQDTESNVKSFADAHGVNYPVAMGDESYKALYGGVQGLPTCFLIGRDGRIYQKITGAPTDLGIFDQSIQTMLKTTGDKPQMAQANTPSSEPVMHQAAAKEAAPEPPAMASAPGLPDLDAQGVQHVIHEFAAKEKIFQAARNNYTYHQINKVEELGPNNEIVGTYEQEWDILYDDAGKRIERVTYAPENTLKGLIITKEDIEGFRSITPFVLTTDEVPEYDIKYLGHVKVDEITAYVFSIRPKEIQKNRQYFQGIVWVDDRDLQIVKSEGKQVPQDKTHHGQENLFPRFSTWREQVDGKFWFPTYTMGDDTLYFSNGPPVHMKEIVRYTDYKQFKTGSRIISVESIDKDKSKDQSNPPPATPQK